MKARAREDQPVVSYLLGMSSELEQNQVEARYFKDQRFYEHVLMVEEELMCEYVSNELSGEERRRFEQHFLQSERRRKKFAATRKLMAYIADQEDWAVSVKAAQLPAAKARTAHSPGSVLDWLSGLLTPKFSLGWMMAATVLLLLCGVALTRHVATLRQEMERTNAERVVLQQQEQSLRGAAARQRAEAVAKRDEAASLTELVANGASNLSASMNQSEPPTQAITNLSLNTVRNATTPTVVNLPRAAAWRLSLQLEPNVPAFPKYVLKLRTPEAPAPVWQGETVASEQHLSVAIPTEGLKPGVYSLSLTGITALQPDQFAGEIFLRLVKE